MERAIRTLDKSLEGEPMPNDVQVEKFCQPSAAHRTGTKKMGQAAGISIRRGALHFVSIRKIPEKSAVPIDMQTHTK